MSFLILSLGKLGIVVTAQDMLMVDSADELFTVPVFAMSHDPLPLWSPDDATKMASKQTRLNNAARVVHPNKRFFQHLVRRIQSGDFKDDPLTLGRCDAAAE